MIAILREQSYTVTHSNKNEQLSEVNKMKNQNFGVEIELTGITRKRAAEVIANYFGTTSHYERGGYDTYTAAQASTSVPMAHERRYPIFFVGGRRHRP